jgi:hypothetical protein
VSCSSDVRGIMCGCCIYEAWCGVCYVCEAFVELLFSFADCSPALIIQSSPAINCAGIIAGTCIRVHVARFTCYLAMYIFH